MSYILRNLFLSWGLLLADSLSAQQPANNPPPATPRNETTGARQNTNDPIAQIRDEGLNRSQVLDILTYLTDVIGPRLTGSPNHKRANEWTRDKLASWGLTKAHLEAWPFGRGWSLKRFSAQVVEPQAIPLAARPKAWSSGFEGQVVAEVVYLDAKTAADTEKYKGKLKGAIVLASSPRELPPRFEPLVTRFTDTDLLKLANASAGRPRAFGLRLNRTNAVPSAGSPQPSSATNQSSVTQPSSPTRAPDADRSARQRSSLDRISFAAREGAAVIVTCSALGDGGTLLAEAAIVVPPATNATNQPAASRSPWATNAASIPPQIVLAAEDYNRLVHMIERGEKLKMAVELEVQYHDHELMGYNTLAEIPGADRENEVVMLGAHLDSWHIGTGATDNGAGVAVVMEAARILQALKLAPRRTIRVGLWGGEEQGFLGSKAYVSHQFGYNTNATNVAAVRSPNDQSRQPARRSASNAGGNRKLIRQHDYDKLVAYFNLDYGGGKVRGVYLQGNDAVRPIFRRWLEPFRDLGAETLTLAGAFGTDHLTFDAIGLPGFQFIQDPLDYFARTHHTTADVLDRIPPEDLKQAAVIMAAFVYNTANLDEKLSRKPTN